MRGIDSMDHETVVRQKMTERYFLDELEPKVRDEFEEHFFDCTDCALDVRATASFVEESKKVMAESTSEERVHLVAPAKQSWFAWLRPAFAVPVFALLLAIVGYQNLVTLPRLENTRQQPQVLPWASVNVGTYGADGPVIRTAPRQGFLLFVRIPPEDGISRYIADLNDPAGKLEGELTIPANSSQDQWPVQVPGMDWKPGMYTLTVHGITSSGESKDLGRTSFELQVQQ